MEISTVTYHFADGTKQVSQITDQSQFDEKGRKRNRQSYEKLFSETAHDIGADSFEF